MTIAICVQVHDGVVLASDSASTLSISGQTGPGSILNVYDNANKIFNLRKGLPIGGVTHGAGSIGVSSISTLSKDLRRRFSGEDKDHIDWRIDPVNFRIEDVAVRVREFFFDEHYKKHVKKPAKGTEFGYMVAGYSSDASLSELWSIEIKGALYT